MAEQKNKQTKNLTKIIDLNAATIKLCINYIVSMEINFPALLKTTNSYFDFLVSHFISGKDMCQSSLDFYKFICMYVCSYVCVYVSGYFCKGLSVTIKN